MSYYNMTKIGYFLNLKPIFRIRKSIRIHFETKSYNEVKNDIVASVKSRMGACYKSNRK